MNEPSALELLQKVDRKADQVNASVENLAGVLKSRVRWLWGVLAVGAVLLAVLIGTEAVILLDNNRDLRASEAKFCGIVDLLIPSADDPPPISERGRQIVVESIKLYKDLGCGPKE